MNTIVTGRKVVVLILAALLLALTVFAGLSANTSTVSDAQAKEKAPSVQQKQGMCWGEAGQWICQ